MRHRYFPAVVLLAFVAGCAGSGTGPSIPSTASKPLVPQAAAASTANVIANPGFETGSLSPWTSCGSVTGDATISTAQAHSGTDSAFIGTSTKPEVNGTAAVCQTVTVPTGGTLSFWVFETTNDTIKFVDQEADVESTSGSVLKQLYSEASSTNGWVQKTFDLSSFAGQTVQLYFGVKGNGFSSDFVNEFLDDVSLTGSSSTAAPSPTPSAAPTSSPTARPTATPTARPTATPTAAPTATPTVAPTATPTGAPTTTPFPCNNDQFNTDQNEFTAGTITADQLVNICGKVTQVLAETDTSSGHHGDYFIQLPSGFQIKIFSNLDAMSQAPTDQPPTTWPWVAVGDFVYVQGRYFFDNSNSQGVDWTEDDTSSSWQHIGFVGVCDTNGANCQKFW